MTAPVSLAAIKARKASLVSGLIGMTEAERDALVELACEAMTRRPIADTPAPQPPATDPHDGWTPLVEGCAMPEHEKTVQVTVVLRGGLRVEMSEFWIFEDGLRMFNVPRVGGFHADGTAYPHTAGRLTAWRPAPEPYRGGV